MKFIFLVLSMALVLQAETAKITEREHSSFHNSTSRPSVQLNNKRNMHHLVKIDETQATQLVKNETGEEILHQELTHQGDILFYKVSTQNYLIEINALDGTILKKVKK